MAPSPVSIGDVIVVPEGNGTWSGKLGRVQSIAVTWCDIAVPIASAEPRTTINHLVRVELASLAPARR